MTLALGAWTGPRPDRLPQVIPQERRIGLEYGAGDRQSYFSHPESPIVCPTQLPRILSPAPSTLRWWHTIINSHVMQTKHDTNRAFIQLDFMHLVICKHVTHPKIPLTASRTPASSTAIGSTTHLQQEQGGVRATEKSMLPMRGFVKVRHK